MDADPNARRPGVGDVSPVVPDDDKELIACIVEAVERDLLAAIRMHRVRDGREVTLLVIKSHEHTHDGEDFTDIIAVAELLDMTTVTEEYIPATPHYIVEGTLNELLDD